MYIVGEDNKASFFMPKDKIRPGETFTGYLTVDPDYSAKVEVLDSNERKVSFTLTTGGIVTVRNVSDDL
jgi:hypothetical protein